MPLRLPVLILAIIPLAAAAQEAPSISAPATVIVPSGPFVMGSSADERQFAYRLDEAAYGHSRTREGRWYESEAARHTATTAAYAITITPITNAQYARFTDATGHSIPDVDAKTWKGYGLIHPYERTRRHAWSDGAPPIERTEHPVVLVGYADAVAYAAWLAGETGLGWRLPTEPEWEKAARGTEGARFPWGNDFDASKLNSHDRGPFDTVAVGTIPNGASPFGLMDAAGQVFEWTATPASPGRFIVKGGSWDDSGCGVCRPAARHGRPQALKHILIGFRLVYDLK